MTLNIQSRQNINVRHRAPVNAKIVSVTPRDNSDYAASTKESKFNIIFKHHNYERVGDS
jgi:hypothetical protein